MGRHINQQRTPIPLSALKKGIRSTKMWPQDEVIKIATDWNDGVDIREIARKHSMPEIATKNKISRVQYLTRPNKNKGEVKRHKKPAKRQVRRHDEHPLAGMRKCNQCGEKFHSWHVRKNQRCDPCKMGQ